MSKTLTIDADDGGGDGDDVAGRGLNESPSGISHWCPIGISVY